MPARPGSTLAPAEVSASRASLLSSGGLSAMPSWVHIHSSIAPAANTPPSSAYSSLPSMLQATGGLRDLRADVGENENTGAIRCLDSAGLHAGRARQRRLLVDHLTAERQ